MNGTTYTYSVFDQHPSCIDTAWSSHDDIEIDAVSDEDAIDQVRDALEIAAAGLGAEPDYEAGDRIFAQVTGPDGVIVATISEEIESS